MYGNFVYICYVCVIMVVGPLQSFEDHSHGLVNSFGFQLWYLIYHVPFGNDYINNYSYMPF